MLKQRRGWILLYSDTSCMRWILWFILEHIMQLSESCLSNCLCYLSFCSNNFSKPNIAILWSSMCMSRNLSLGNSNVCFTCVRVNYACTLSLAPDILFYGIFRWRDRYNFCFNLTLIITCFSIFMFFACLLMWKDEKFDGLRLILFINDIHNQLLLTTSINFYFIFLQF